MKNLNIEQLIDLKDKTLRELQMLEADFTASNADIKNIKSNAEKQQELEWRASAVEQKREILERLRVVKAELKIKQAEATGANNYGDLMRINNQKLDDIINILKNIFNRINAE